jgi:hypothetical protein
LVVALLIVAGFLTLVQIDHQAVADTKCDPAAVMTHRLDELGRGGYDWSIAGAPLESGNRAVTDLDEHLVIVSPIVTCAEMPSVVNHEWMHVQQGWKYGSSGRVYGAYGAFEVAMVADCGSMLLGSTLTPYVTRHRQETGVGCSDYEMAAARSLIEKSG